MYRSFLSPARQPLSFIFFFFIISPMRGHCQLTTSVIDTHSLALLSNSRGPFNDCWIHLQHQTFLQHSSPFDQLNIFHLSFTFSLRLSVCCPLTLFRIQPQLNFFSSYLYDQCHLRLLIQTSRIISTSSSLLPSSEPYADHG